MEETLWEPPLGLSSQMKVAPKKRFGQHFLRDTSVLGRIVRLCELSSRDVVIEIGAGEGALSILLAPRVARLIAVELDVDCIPSLQQRLSAHSNAVVIRDNIMHLDIPGLLAAYLGREQRLRIIGNLPYYLATAIIERLLSSNLPIADMIFMIQLEVAQRITASHGSKSYGFFSVYCQHLSDVRIAFRVAPSCFEPRPKVMSALILLKPKTGRRDPLMEARFAEFVKAAFRHRRKTLANSLREHPTIGPKAAEILRRAEIDGSRRAENLSVAEYERLAAS